MKLRSALGIEGAHPLPGSHRIATLTWMRVHRAVEWSQVRLRQLQVALHVAARSVRAA